jgi:hypothetical protein
MQNVILPSVNYSERQVLIGMLSVMLNVLIMNIIILSVNYTECLLC